jgi:multimeric flavodoxin WrbA/putative sterol carrier protein
MGRGSNRNDKGVLRRSNMKSVLVLNGSPRGKKGNTQKLVDRFLQGIRDTNENINIDQIYLKDEHIKNCIGCFTCWEKTPGKCIHEDSMGRLLKKYIDGDIIIWATPLYHYNMTSILKVFVERTLPVNKPDIIKKDNIYTHPQRYELGNKKHILISNCGFPQYENFSVLIDEFKRITGNRLSETILCVEGELLRVTPLESKIKWYLDSVHKSAIEFIRDGEFSKETRRTLKEPLMAIDKFVEMANLSWHVNEDYGKDSEDKESKAYKFLKLMALSMNEKEAKDLDHIIGFHFTDLDEEYYLTIKDEKCIAHRGNVTDFTTKIITTFKVWKEISEGHLDGPKAMMEGLYKIEGSLQFLMKFNKLFSSNRGKEEKGKSPKKVFGLNGEKWLAIGFIPWNLSWIFIKRNMFLGVWLPFLISLGVLIVKRNSKHITYFEKLSFFYFCQLIFISKLNSQFINEKGIILNYMAIGIIWLTSTITSVSLTGEYSKYRYDVSMENNKIFEKTNKIMTLFWAFIFFIQGIIVITLKGYGLIKYYPCVYVLLLVAGAFTKWFPNWYPQYVARGKKLFIKP